MEDAELNARFERVDARFEQVDARFEQVDARFKDIEDLIKTEGEATRRHIDVVAAGLSGQIKLLAERYDALRTDVTDLKEGQQRLETGFGRLELRMLSLESRMLSLESRQTKLERTQKVVLTGVRLLAAPSRVRRASRRN